MTYPAQTPYYGYAAPHAHGYAGTCEACGASLFQGIAYADYGYVEQPKGTLAALDEFGAAAGTAPYHCVRQ